MYYDDRRGQMRCAFSMAVLLAVAPFIRIQLHVPSPPYRTLPWYRYRYRYRHRPTHYRYRYRYRYPLHAERTHLWGQPYHTRYWYSCSYSLSPVSRTEFRVPRIICCARPTFLARVLRLLSIEELSAYPLVADGGGSVAAAGRLLSTFSCKTACAVQLH